MLLRRIASQAPPAAHRPLICRRMQASAADGAGAAAAPAASGGSSGAAAPAKVVLVVAVALIDQQRRVLLAQRPEGRAMAGLWEFPGGKVDPGEVPEAALVRELREELGIQVAAADLKPLTFASHSYDTFHLLMPLYECRSWGGSIGDVGKEGQRLRWAAAGELRGFEMPAADVPLIEPIQAALAR